ncbi:MAG: hypothetical protein HY722_03735 [Planctomycetes bacterium]|nr:hypothetical protein [Planctomycetota bacterium]
MDSVIGPHRLARRLGQGGMETVYLAHHPGLDRLDAHAPRPPPPRMRLRWAMALLFLAAGCRAPGAPSAYRCEDCGALVAASATRCFRCGVEFETVGGEEAGAPVEGAAEEEAEGEEDEGEEEEGAEEGGRFFRDLANRGLTTPEGEVYCETGVTVENGRTRRVVRHRGEELEDEERSVFEPSLRPTRLDLGLSYGLTGIWELGLGLPATSRRDETLTRDTLVIEREESWGSGDAVLSTLVALPGAVDTRVPARLAVGASLEFPTDGRRTPYKRGNRGSGGAAMDLNFLFEGGRYVFARLGGALDFDPVDSSLEAALGAGFEPLEDWTISAEMGTIEEEATAGAGISLVVRETLLVSLSASSVVTDGDRDLSLGLSLGY